jgi:hypothetical protein
MLRTVWRPKAGHVAGFDLDPAVVDTSARSQTTRQDAGRQGARLRSADPEMVRPVVHEIANGREGAFGQQPALGDDQDLGTETLDLVQHVARDDNRLAGIPQPSEHVDRSQPLTRVQAFQGFVENQQIRVVDQRLRQLHSLPHALGVGAQRSGVARIQLDRFDGPGGRLLRTWKFVQDGRDLDELGYGLPLEQPLLLRRDADSPGQLGVGAGVFTEDPYRSLGRIGQPADDAEER